MLLRLALLILVLSLLQMLGLQVITTMTKSFESFNFFFLSLYMFVCCVHMCVCVCMCIWCLHVYVCLSIDMYHVWRPEDTLQVSVLSFHHVELTLSGMVASPFTSWTISLSFFLIFWFWNNSCSPGWPWTWVYKLLTFLPLSPKCWEYGLVSPCLLSSDLFEFKLDHLLC